MVINHVHNDTDSCIMISLNHGLEVSNNLSGIIWITRETCFWSIVVLRVITPVIGYISILIIFLMTIKDRLKLNIVATKFFNIVKGGCLTVLVNCSSLSSTQEGSAEFFRNTRCRRLGKITNMHFTDNCFTWILQTPWRFCPMSDFKSFYLSVLMRKNYRTFPVRTCCSCVRISRQSLVVRKFNLILISLTSKIFI